MREREITVSITPGAVVTTLLILFGAYVLWLLRDLAVLVVTAVVIASAVEPGIAFFIRHRLPRFFATLLMYLTVLGALFGLVYFFLPPILADATGFISAVPQYLDTLQLPSTGLAQATSVIGGAHEAQSLLASITGLENVFSSTGTGVVQLVATFFGGIFSLVLVVVLSFYFALSDTGVDDFLRIVLPAKHEEYAVNLWRRSQVKIGRWMQGQILLSVIVGILVYLGLLILAVPYALLLAVLTAVAEIIPIFGSLLAGATSAAVAYSVGGFPLALIVAGLFVVVNQFESNLIYPLIVKKVVGVPPLLVIVALIAGWTLAGFLGVLLSVPVAAAALEFLSDFDKRKRREAKSA